MLLLHSIKRDAALPVMVTLTFPAELRVSPAEAKACRLAWEKRMIRRYGSRWCSIWRLEAHPELSAKLGRVHPHFHCLTWGAWYDLRELSEAWTSVIWEVLDVDPCLSDADGELVRDKSDKAGTNAERLRCWGGVVYCGKNYIAKEEAYPLGKAGRVWGYCRRSKLPLAKVERVPLSVAEVVAVRCAVEKWMDEKNIVSESLIRTFFCESPLTFVGRLMAKASRGSPMGLPVRPSASVNGG